MDRIDIPDGYWTIRPRGFQEFAAPYAERLGELAGDVVTAADPLLSGDAIDTWDRLTTVDVDAPQIYSDAALESDAIITTPTGDVLGKYAGADAMAANADSATPPEGVGYRMPIMPTPPVEPPPDNGNPMNPGEPAPAPPPSGGPTLPTFEDVDWAFMTFMGRHATLDEYHQFWEMRLDWYSGIQNSDEAKAYAASQHNQPPPPAAATEATTTTEAAAPPVEAPPAPAPGDLPVTRAELAAALEKLAPTITLMV